MLQINADGSVTVLKDTSISTYDGYDDTMVGVVNNSTSSVQAVTVTGPGSGLSGFDADGLCAYGVSGCPFGPTGYEGPATSLVTAASMPDSAQVNFTGGLGPNKTAYFSLEGVLTSAQLTARQGTLQGDSYNSSGASYVALGDSYSSGEGNPPFLASTDGPTDHCHRSAAAYPELLTSNYNLNLHFYACSGATTINITTKKRDTEIPQIKHPALNPNAALVTLTIGGNDAGFGDVLTACMFQRVTAELDALVSLDPWLGLSGSSCVDSSNFDASVTSQIDQVLTPARNTYEKVLGVVSIAGKTNTSVIAAGYPQIFPTDPSAQSCDQLLPLLSSSDQNVLDTWASRLDGVLSQAAGQAGVNFVDPQAAFAGHAVCGTGGAWINGVTTNSGYNGVGSFHPNAQGHAGYESVFANFINQATSLTPAGFPTNPAPTPDPPPPPYKGTDQIGGLHVTPPASGPYQCEQAVQAGQEVAISAGGFVPATTVRLYAVAAGLGPRSQASLDAPIDCQVIRAT